MTYSYFEKPQLHFIPPTGWMNDPNGLVFFENEWHLFYQYLPVDGIPGKHWGHAVSGDLLHWEHLPIALYPDTLGEIFSGSAVVDEKDSSGFFGGRPGLVAIFTHHRDDNGKIIECQSLAYSADRGRTWTKYADNPVLCSGNSDFRDPKVFWHSASNAWVMIVAAGIRAEIYRSSDLKSWTFASTFGEGHSPLCWECPDLFPQTDENGREVWILTTSLLDRNTFTKFAPCLERYYSGTFDGFIFTPDSTSESRSLSEGPDDYAAVTFANTPDGSRILLGWLNHWGYAFYTGQMTLPRQLIWSKNALKQTVVPRVDQAGKWPRVEVDVAGKNVFPIHFVSHPWEVAVGAGTSSWRMEACKGGQMIFQLERNVARGVWSLQRATAGYPAEWKKEKPDTEAAFTAVQEVPIEMGETMPSRIIVDACSVEIFCDGGHRYFAAQIFPPPGEWKIRFVS